MIQFLFTRTLSRKGKKSLYPPIGDLILISIGIIICIFDDNFYIRMTSIGMLLIVPSINLGIDLERYVRQKNGDVAQ